MIVALTILNTAVIISVLIYLIVQSIKFLKSKKYEKGDLEVSTLFFVLDYLKNVMFVLKISFVKIIQECQFCKESGVCEEHRDLFNFLGKLEILRSDLERLIKKYFLNKNVSKKTTN
jgi:hypothetical protein